jgi:hypothetical protein
VCVIVLARCVFLVSALVLSGLPRCGPCLPFYSFQGKGSDYICGKKMKWRKDEREKQKRWSRVRPSSSLSSENSFPCSAEMQHALIFWPLHPLVQHVVAMLCPMCFCAVEDGRYGCPDLRREGSRWYSCRHPCRCRGMDVIVVEWPGSCWVRAWFPCSYSLCTVTSVPSAGVGAVVGGPRGSTSFQRAPRVPRVRRKYTEGVGRFDDVMGA